jgi:hypothetical protein
MGQAAKKAVDRLRVIGSGQSPTLRELDETRDYFRFRLNKVLSNLPPGEIIEVPPPNLGPKGTIPLFPEDRDTEAESPGDLAAQEPQATR